MKTVITSDDLAAIQYTGKNRRDEPVTLATFNSLQARQKVYLRRTSLRNTPGVWNNEDLVPEISQLNFQARSLFRQGKINKNWTHLGAIFIKVRENGQVLKIYDKKQLYKAAYTE